MGNCIVLQEKVVRVMKPDGKILEYKAPVRVEQILSDYSGHAIYESLQNFQLIPPDSKLLGGRLYYLVALPLPSSESSSQVVKKKVRFSIPEEENKQETGVVRIKLVISKKELQEILQKGGVAVDYMVSQLQDQQRVQRVDISENNDNQKAWKPVLESIPEID